MRERMILAFVVMLYHEMLRPLILAAINDPNSEWDDITLELLDRLLPEK